VVKGEWSTVTGTSTSTSHGVTTTTTTLVSTTMNCVNDGTTACGNNLGNTYGIPQIRRFHNGSWGAVFGNGFSSVSGDAGIYVMLVNPASTTGTVTFYYLSTGQGSATNPNGIAYVTAADLDGDHITDYVYAGDLLGNVWRFDLTSTSPSSWAVTSTPVFTTPSGQPITTKLSVISAAGTGSANPRILIEFGTGRQTPITNSAAGTYSTTTQALYGIWDWNMSAWNTLSTVQDYATLSSHAAISGTSLLQVQTITSTATATMTGTGSDYRTVSSSPVCYADVSGCTQFGWYLNLVSGNAYPLDPALPQTGNAAYAANPMVYEQVIFSPVVESGAFIVNTTIPPATAPTMCFSSPASGWTMALNPTTGGAFTNAFFGDSNGNFLTTAFGGSPAAVSGIALGGTGSPSLVQSGTQSYVVTQTVSGTGALVRNFPQGNNQGKRLTWIQKR
jgi:type IV pilus assembly protein PilY1